MIIEKNNFHLEDAIVPEALKPMMDDFQSFVLLRNVYHSAIREISTKLEVLDEEFCVRYDYNPIHHMVCRVKSPQSLFEKLERKGLNIAIDDMKKITDFAGVRVICNYVDDVYAVAALLLRQDDIRLIRKTDYIKEPKPSGYRSLHIVVEVPVFLSDRTELVPVEVQLRTVAMDTWASLEHQLKYKQKKAIPDELEKELRDCAERMAEIDEKMEKIHKAL